LEAGADPGIEMLFCFNKSRDLTGVVLNVACPAQVLEHMSVVTADYWGEVRHLIRRSFGDSVHVLPLIAAAGDQSPRDLVRRGRGEPDMHSVTGMEELASRIVSAVTRALPGARGGIDREAVVDHRMKRVALPLRTVTRAEAMRARKELARYRHVALEKAASIANQHAGIEEFYAHGIANRYDRQATRAFYRTEVHAVRIGDCAFITNPFELFTEYGMRMKARTSATHTFVAQLACDNGGYLPTAAAVAHGGYSAEVANGFVGPDGGDRLVEESVRMVNRMWTKSRT
jgi:hypothetical protein